MTWYRPLALAVQRQFNDFDPASRGVDTSRCEGDHAPLFVVGTPRSGSTACYQYLLGALELTFVSNLMSLAPKAMVRIHRRSWRTARRRAGKMKRAHLGFIPGLLSPSEAGKVMDRWFDGTKTARYRQPVRETVAALSAAAGCPLVVKCPTLAVDLDRIEAVFPAARYLWLRRDPRYVVQSIVGKWRAGVMEPDQFRVIRPEGWREHVHETDVVETAWRVVAIESGIAEHARRVGGRLFELQYETFCTEPREQIGALADAFGIRASGLTMPAHLPQGNKVRVDLTQWHEIESAVAQQRASNGW